MRLTTDYGIPVEVEHLEVADVIIGDIAVERKTMSGFINDIKTKRIFEQAYNMSRNFKKNHSIIVIISDNLLAPKYYPMVYGAIARIWCSFSIPTIVVPNMDAYLRLLASIYANKLGKKYRRIVPMRKIETVRDMQIAMLCAIRGINEKRAVKMLEKWRTIKNIVNCTIEQLTSIKGISVEMAKRIYDVFNSEFQT